MSSAETAGAASSPAAAADDVIPSHTDAWSEEKRAEYASYVASQRLDAEPRIEAHERIIYDFGKGPCITKVKPGTDLRLRNGKARVDAVIGLPFHTVFSVERGTLVRREAGKLKPSTFFGHSRSEDPNFLPSATNEELYDNDQGSQTITHEAIERMKAEGVAGEDIIRAVAAASKTFDSKTEFSQEKWLKKKMAKYSTDVAITRPSPQSLLGLMLEKEGKRVMYLRDDTIAHMLQLANVGAGSRTLVVETCGGLITGAVAHRQGGHGLVLNAFIGQSPLGSLVEDMNLPPQVRASIIPFPISAIGTVPPVNKSVDIGVSFAAAPAAPAPVAAAADASSAMTDDPTAGASSSSSSSSSSAEEAAAAGPGAGAGVGAQGVLPPRVSVLREAHTRAIGELAQGAHSLVVVTNHSPLELVVPLLGHLLPSSSFVVYGGAPEPLLRLRQFLVSTRMAANVEVVEYLTREIQVLPNRTHPEMTTSGTGGYLLTGITVAGDAKGKG